MKHDSVRSGAAGFGVSRATPAGKAGLELVDGEAQVCAGAKVRPVKTEAR